MVRLKHTGATFTNSQSVRVAQTRVPTKAYIQLMIQQKYIFLVLVQRM